MTALLLFYIISNIIVWIILSLTGLDNLEYYGFKYALIYPWIWDILDDHNINILGKLIVCILFTLIALAAYILWLITLGLVYFAYDTGLLFCKIFAKR